MKKWIKILLVTLGILAVLVVTTILRLPPIAKNYLEKHSKELVGRQITIEKLRFNVLNGKLRIDQIAMLEPDDSTTFASLGNFYTRIHLLPLLRNRVHIDAVLIDRPYLKVYQDGTSFNFDDLLTRFLPPADTVEKAPSKPWTVDIDDIKIHNGELTYKDMQRNVTWGFNELDIDVPGLHLSGHERTDMGIVFNFSRGGSLRTSLEYDQATADYDLSLLLSNLSLAGTAAYFNQVIDIGSVEGLVTLDLHVKGNANHLLDLRTYGIAAASGLKLRDSRNNRIIDVDTLNFDLRDGNLGTMQYDIRRIYAAGIRTQFEIYRGGGNNLLALIKAPEERPTETEATIDGETTVTIEREEPATTQLNFTVGELLLDKGEIAFTDNTFEKRSTPNCNARDRAISVGKARSRTSTTTTSWSLCRTSTSRISPPTANISRPTPLRAATSRSAARTSSPTVFSTARTTSTYSNARSTRNARTWSLNSRFRSSWDFTFSKTAKDTSRSTCP